MENSLEANSHEWTFMYPTNEKTTENGIVSPSPIRMLYLLLYSDKNQDIEIREIKKFIDNAGINEIPFSQTKMGGWSGPNIAIPA